MPFTLPGETVEAEAWPGHPDRRLPIKIEHASPERITPVCPHFGTCGGCALQHWTAARYRDWKRGLVLEALSQAGLDAPVDDLIDAHGEGRRRMVLHARRGQRDVLKVGFAAPRAHHIVAIDRCPILAPALDGAIAAAWAIAETIEDHAQAARHSGDRDRRRPRCRLARIRAADARPRPRRLRASPSSTGWRGSRVTARSSRNGRRPAVTMGRARVVLPPGAFLQATAAGEAALAALVLEHCGKADRIADLFAGVGPFALRLAERARVTAADSDKDAIAALKRAAETTQGLKPIAAETRDLFRRPLAAAELKNVDCRRVRPAAPGRRGAGTRARGFSRAGRGGGVVQSRDFRPRCPHPRRRRLSPHAGHADRPVPLFAACGDRGAAGEIEHDPEKWEPVFGKRSCSSKKLNARF